MATMDGPVLAASAAVFRDGRLLLSRRVAPPQLWSLPGGRIHFGEAAAEAAAREVFEETGVEATILGFAGHREVLLRDENGVLTGHFVVLAFAGRWRAGEAKTSAEAAAVEWVQPSAIGRLKTTDGLADIVRAAEPLAAG